VGMDSAGEGKAGFWARRRPVPALLVFARGNRVYGEG
jgi:hypothetical protein